jgi:hypothetical protein
MVVLAAANVLFTTWATVIDTRRFSAVALLGIPAGIALYGAVQTGGSQAGVPLPWLLLLVLGMLATVAALTAAPAGIGTRRPVAQILQAETT